MDYRYNPDINDVDYAHHTGTFFVTFGRGLSSICGDDFEETVHGKIYNRLINISDEIIIYGLDKKFHSLIHEQYGEDFSSLNKRVTIKNPVDFAIKFNNIINLDRRNRGSIFISIARDKMDEVNQAISICDDVGVLSTLNQTMLDTSKASVELALGKRRAGDFAFLVGCQTGAKMIHCFGPDEWYSSVFEIFAWKAKMLKGKNGW